MKHYPSSDPRALIIGAGIAGLTTARCLQEQGFSVTVIADRFQGATTSVIAGALWEWPPAVCGLSEGQGEQALVAEQRWCVESYRRFEELAQSERTGVYWRPAIFYLDAPAAENPVELRKLREVQQHVKGFRHDAGLASRPGINVKSGFVDAYTYETPLIDTDVYMAWLLGEVLGHGGAIEWQRVYGPLATAAPALSDAYWADVIVNCAGLGARELSQDDDVIPVRGAWLIVENDGRSFPVITAAHCSSPAGSTEGGNFLFIVPRGRDRLILGGIRQPHHWHTELGRERDSILDSIWRQCTRFMPCLANAIVFGHAEHRVGLRPFRRAGLRVARESGAAVVHNYGHGGSGVALSWGCAQDAARLARQAITEASGQLALPLGALASG